MKVDYIIVGQGVAGTFLSYYLMEQGKSVLVIDQPQIHTPSRIAAGIMNPVTGRRLVTVWKAEEILEYAPLAYEAIGKKLGIEAISRKDIIDIFPNVYMRQSFEERVNSGNDYVRMGEEKNLWTNWLNIELGYGYIQPVYTAHLQQLIPAWQQYLQQKQMYWQQQFEIKDLQVEKDHVLYQQAEAKKIIFCDGPEGAANTFFQNLPFAKNKGEALILRIPDLPNDYIFKKSQLLVPLPDKEMFWMGSSYEWNFDHLQPTREYYDQATTLLKSWLKCDYKVEDHKAGLRPATLERRPFVGLHPLYPSIGILNGMGTKGCSLSPFFARQLTQHLLHNEPITPEADVQRFHKLLSRG